MFHISSQVMEISILIHVSVLRSEASYSWIFNVYETSENIFYLILLPLKDIIN